MWTVHRYFVQCSVKLPTELSLIVRMNRFLKGTGAGSEYKYYTCPDQMSISISHRNTETYGADRAYQSLF